MADSVGGLGYGAGGTLAGIEAVGELQQQKQAATLAPYVYQEEQQKLQQGSLTLQKTRLQLEQQQRMMAAIKAHASTLAGGSGNPMDQLASDNAFLAQVALESGNPEAAREYAETAANVQRTQLEATQTQAQMRVRQITDFDTLLGSATDASSWDQAKTLFLTMHPEVMRDQQAAPALRRIMSQPYSSQLVQTLRNGTMTGLQRAQMAADQARTKASQAETQLHQVQTQAATLNLRYAQEQDAALKKNGGEASGAVGMALSGMPLTQIVSGSGQNASRQRAAVRDAAIAQIQAENPSLNAEQAGEELATRQQDYHRRMSAGAMNQRYAGRVLGAANEGEAALTSIARMGTTGSIFGRVNPSDTVVSFFTSARVKEYNATIAGLAPEIAYAQNQGMAPNDEQVREIREALTIGATDDVETARYKIALGARYLRKGVDSSMPLASPEQQAKMREIDQRLAAFPDPDTVLGLKPGTGYFPQRPKAAPAVGTIQQGYRFKGGDPGNPASWERVQ